MRNRNVSYPRGGIIACLYLLLGVVLIISLIYLYGGTKPGVYYKCDDKIPATVKTAENMKFKKVGEWEPLIIPGTNLYIIHVDVSTCTVVYDGGDSMHTSYTENVPLANLNYDTTLMGKLQKSKNYSVSYMPDDSNSALGSVARVLVIGITAFLVISFVAFVVTRVRGR